MSAFTLKIRTDNEAFNDDNKVSELARLLRHAADEVERGVDNNSLRDINGNIVGQYEGARI